MTDPKSVVYELLAEMTSKPVSYIRDDQRLVKDLRVDGDDYGMWFVKEVEKRLNIKPSIEEWSQVRTVADILSIVRQHTSSQWRSKTCPKWFQPTQLCPKREAYP